MKKAKPKPPRRPAPPATPPGSGKRALNVEAVARSLRPQPRPSERYGACRRSPLDCEGTPAPRMMFRPDTFELIDHCEWPDTVNVNPCRPVSPHFWRRAKLRRGQLDLCWKPPPPGSRYAPGRRHHLGAATLAALGIAALGGA